MNYCPILICSGLKNVDMPQWWNILKNSIKF